MICASKNGRSVLAMVFEDGAVNGVMGVVQCNLAGCEASLVLLVERHGKLETAAEQIDWFLDHHECDTMRFTRPRLRPGQRLWVPGARSSWGVRR